MEDSLLETINAERAASPRRGLRWVLVSGFALNMLCNHWSRDSFGAIASPLETDGHLSEHQYNTLSSLYFLPNVLMPILAGLCAQLEPRKSGAHTFLVMSVFAAVGNLIVNAAAWSLGAHPSPGGARLTRPGNSLRMPVDRPDAHLLLLPFPPRRALPRGRFLRGARLPADG